MAPGSPFDPDQVLAVKLPETTYGYTERDVALYALGVGACGRDAVDAHELKRCCIDYLATIILCILIPRSLKFQDSPVRYCMVCAHSDLQFGQSLNAFAEEMQAVKTISARFLLRVYPGETLITEMWLEGYISDKSKRKK